MRIAVTGSIATDHLMTFPGRFTDHLLEDRLHTVSLSFLVDELEVRRGGVGPNICFGLARLGLTPLLLGAAGQDFDSYRAWLEENGVDTTHVLVSDRHQTARFVCTTDRDNNQIASFYAGAMAEARHLDLGRVRELAGAVDLVLIGADDPDAMLRHAAECRALGIPFAADPSQQLARIPGEGIKSLVDGAAYLFGNEYERDLLTKHTGWTPQEIAERVEVWVTTLAGDGVRVQSADGTDLQVPAVPVAGIADPTGCGDALRAGFLAARSWNLSLERAAQLGCAMAALTLETVGTQTYAAHPEEILERLASAYGEQVSTDFEPWLVRESPRLKAGTTP
ncbi:carbohydrate kinase family protein [Actinospica durhamensis]|uniref:Carbohydrate kinase family protein n=1 Tax=Actinospica durhamensis TaxID=1508375 RepID=A0A941EYI7_9ACTN|nr:carbohydrate kinase family protein [Actinospica durhamensis]MBR7839641.1 carbohydrate kinase family protein [Actinospica durhamensis]